MDDVTTGGSVEEVDRMQGTKMADGQFTGTIPAMARAVGLELKTMVRSGSKDKDATHKLSGTVLGYNWWPEEDLLEVPIKFNTSKRRKGLRSKPNLKDTDIDDFKLQNQNRQWDI